MIKLYEDLTDNNIIFFNDKNEVLDINGISWIPDIKYFEILIDSLTINDIMWISNKQKLFRMPNHFDVNYILLCEFNDINDIFNFKEKHPELFI